MSELSALEERLEAALAAIQTALAKKSSASGAEDPKTAALTAENAKLRKDLNALQAKRDQDMADLDALLRQLEPLIEEVN